MNAKNLVDRRVYACKGLTLLESTLLSDILNIWHDPKCQTSKFKGCTVKSNDYYGWEFNQSPRTIQRAINNLCKLGLITRKSKMTKFGGSRKITPALDSIDKFIAKNYVEKPEIYAVDLDEHKKPENPEIEEKTLVTICPNPSDNLSKPKGQFAPINKTIKEKQKDLLSFTPKQGEVDKFKKMLSLQYPKIRTIFDYYMTKDNFNPNYIMKRSTLYAAQAKLEQLFCTTPAYELNACLLTLADEMYEKRFANKGSFTLGTLLNYDVEILERVVYELTDNCAFLPQSAEPEEKTSIEELEQIEREVLAGTGLIDEDPKEIIEDAIFEPVANEEKQASTPDEEEQMRINLERVVKRAVSVGIPKEEAERIINESGTQGLSVAILDHVPATKKKKSRFAGDGAEELLKTYEEQKARKNEAPKVDPENLKLEKNVIEKFGADVLAKAKDLGVSARAILTAENREVALITLGSLH